MPQDRAEPGPIPPDAAAAFELQAFLPYLMARVGSLMAQSFAPSLARAGITLPMWRVMMVVRFNGPLTLIDLSRATGLTSSTLSRLVGRMIDRGLMSRRRSRHDARTVRISLRPRGEALFREMWPEAARLDELVSAPFEDAEVERLREMLREIEAILARRAGIADTARRGGDKPVTAP